jgi:Taurine catabolism dioxygenase TauD, TfdA family
MAPSAIAIHPSITDVIVPKKDTIGLPPNSRARLEAAGIDLSGGYPYRPLKPIYLDDIANIRNDDRAYTDAGSRADPEKKALFSAAKEVINLTNHIGTEIVGLQLKDLTEQQKDELGLLIAERSVVFFRDQDISPQEQKKLGEWYGEIEVHVRAPFWLQPIFTPIFC